MSVNTNELNTVLEKVSELKVFFDFGQKTVPVLEDVSAFVREVGPAVESLKAMIEVTSERIPRATEQLGRVNQTSEQASTDILNTLDKMNALLDSLLTHDAPCAPPDVVLETSQKMSQWVSILVDKAGWDTDIRELFNLWDLHQQSLKSLRPEKGLRDKLKSLKDDCTNIMMALQVQDITGQQIAMVIGILQAIGDVLNTLASHFSDVAGSGRDEQKEQNVQSGGNVGSDDTKRLVESLLVKARTGELVRH